MEKFKYRALNANGRPVKGVLSALNENDLFNQLQSAGMELISCTELSQKKGPGHFLAKVKARDKIQLFIHLDQMEGAGIPILDALADIRDTCENPVMRDAMSEVYRDTYEGAKLSEAMAKHPKIFTNLLVSLVASGEETGKMGDAYKQLIKYLKWTDAMETRIRKATRYPMILGLVVTGAIGVMMGVVVPQIVGFLRSMDFALPFPTVALIATSDFVVNHWLAMIVTIAAVIAAFVGIRKSSESAAYKIDEMILKMPVMGDLVRKINISRFCQTFGALYASGLPILQAMSAATNTVDNRCMIDALGGIEATVKNGAPLSEAFNRSGEFPSLVVRMLKVGEDSGNLTVVLQQVSDFYTSDVDEAVEKMIAMIEPSLTMVLGLMILWIAAGVFGPIYNNLGNMQF